LFFFKQNAATHKTGQFTLPGRLAAHQKKKKTLLLKRVWFSMFSQE